MYSKVNQLYVYILKNLILFIYFWPHCMWDPGSPTRDRTHTLKSRVITTGPPGKPPRNILGTLGLMLLTDAHRTYISLCCCSVTKLCLTLCELVDCSTPGSSVLHYLLEFAQTHVHRAGDAIQPCHPLSPPSPPALSLSQHQGLF